MQGDLRRGLLVGGLIAFATIGPLLYDDYIMHVSAIEMAQKLNWSGGPGMWIPFFHADIEVMASAGVALIALAVIAWRIARGTSAWPIAVAGGVLAAITIYDSTTTMSHYSADATFTRMAIVPLVATTMLVLGLVLAYRDRAEHRPRFA